MKGKIVHLSLLLFLAIQQSHCVWAQGGRTQYPSILMNSYVGVNAGYINYSFSQQQLEPGFEAQSIQVPHMALRIVLFGHRFNNYLSAQISYMRPAGFVKYENINGTSSSYEVGMNIAGLTLLGDVPVSKKVFLHGEAGLGIITRGGFIVNNTVAMKDANYASVLLGAGAGYRLNKNWDFLLSATWSPENKDQKQPATSFYSLGFNYTMRSLPAETVERNKKTGYIFPKNLLQIGFASNIVGYGVNDFFSKTIPIFWGGDAKVERGMYLQYQRNIFHTRKVFSFDVGATAGWWRTDKNQEQFFTLALFPLFRFTAFHWKPFDLYFNYSLAGPSFISKTILDGNNTGKKFTFQDFMGMGVFAGKKRQLNAELRIAHYSNGNLFPKNDGVMVPLSLGLGYTFD
jgi:hypothetical protein